MLRARYAKKASFEMISHGDWVDSVVIREYSVARLGVMGCRGEGVGSRSMAGSLVMRVLLP